jgi:hypothetical protein
MRNRRNRTESRARRTDRRIDRQEGPIRRRPQENQTQRQEQIRTKGKPRRRSKVVRNVGSRRQGRRLRLSQIVLRIGIRATRANGAHYRRTHPHRPARPRDLATERETTHLAYPRRCSGEIGSGKGAGDEMALGEGSQPGS